MSLQDQRSAGIARGPVSADHGACLGEIMLDRAEAAQRLQLLDIDMPVIDLIAALPQQIADHILARTFGAAGRGYRDEIPGGRDLRIEIGVDGIEDLLLDIAGIHFRHCSLGRSLRRAGEIAIKPHIIWIFWGFCALSESRRHQYTAEKSTVENHQCKPIATFCFSLSGLS